jgi:predicted Holliday junction resolvase-like endonuclease
METDDMAASMGEIFGALGQLMTVCPDCGELFYVSEAHPYYEGQKPHSSLDKLRSEENRLREAEERLDDLEVKFREKAARAGLLAIKRLLRKIDPVFSGSGYDPQDVKVMFHPVTYVVFKGMAQGEVTEVQLLTTPPQNQLGEQVQSSIEETVGKGNFEFRKLRVDGQGRVS